MMSVVVVLFFFFKQKTAYEMRISDWSSDVCSSDLFEQHGPRDWTIFEQYARDANIALLEIQDPYCCADGQARGRLVNFISRFGQLASQIADVHVVAFDADSVQTREPESTNDQRREIGRATGRERVCQYVLISVVAVSLKKKRK